jgi:hypothetical protein
MKNKKVLKLTAELCILVTLGLRLTEKKAGDNSTKCFSSPLTAG